MPSYHNFGSEQQWLITVSVAVDPADQQLAAAGINGNPFTTSGTDPTQGIFDSFSGGDVTATEVKHRPGGMGPEITYLSLPSYSNVTVSRVYETQRDHQIISQLNLMAGRCLGTVTVQPLDDGGNVWGEARVYNGRFISVKDGKTDSNSNAARMYELEFAIETIGG